MIDEGEVLAREVAVGAEEASLEMLAARDAEFQRLGPGAGGGQGTCAPAQAAFAARGKAVKIGPVGLQSRDLDMDAEREFGAREVGALGDDFA